MDKLHRVSIVFSFTDDFIVPSYIAISSLLDSANLDTQYEVIILHQNITQKHIKLIRKLFYHTHHIVKFKKVDTGFMCNYPISDRWSEIVYIRLFMGDFLKDYDKVIYSDVDVLFKGDLYSLYKTDISDFEWGGIRAERNNSRMIGHRYFPNNKNKYVYMSGFMLCNLKKWREIKFSDTVRKNIQKYGNKLLMFDLDILNMSTIHIMDIPIRYAYLMDFYEADNITKPFEYKYMRKVYTRKELEREKQKVVIIHYTGEKKKPWNRFCPPKEYWDYIKRLPLDLKWNYIRNRWEKNI